MTLKTPNNFLTLYSKFFPDIWNRADEIRKRRGKDFDWPQYCFLPLVYWGTLIGVQADVYRTENLQLLFHAQNLAALGAWRYTQDIYTFQPDLFKSLFKTKLPGDIPADIILHMPQWCMYVDLLQNNNVIELMYDKDENRIVYGFFVFIEYHKIPELRFVLNISGNDCSNLLCYGPIVLLGEWSVKEALQKWELCVARQNNTDELFKCTNEGDIKFTTTLLSITLYICSEAPDVIGDIPGTYPKYPTPRKTKRGMRLFPPPKPSIWKVGLTLEEELRRAEKAYQKRMKDAGETGHVPRRAHIRNAHWHKFWVGPKKPKPGKPDGGQVRRLVPRWLWQISVGVGDDEEEEDA
jgi:hypothetical protein